MSEALIHAIHNYFGVDSLSKIPYDRYVEEVNRAIQSETNLSEVASSFLESYIDVPPKKNGHVRPLVIGADFSKLNEVQIGMRSLLACNSVAILIDSDGEYPFRFLCALYFFEDHVLDGSIILIPVTAQTMSSQEFHSGVFFITAKQIEADLKWATYDELYPAIDDLFSSFVRKSNLSYSEIAELEDSLDVDEKFEALYAFASMQEIGVENGVRSSLGMAMDIASRRPDDFDLATFRRGDIAHVKEILERVLALEQTVNEDAARDVGELLATRLPGGDRLFYLPEVLDVRLPIKRVPYKYVRRIREEDTFSQWINALRTAVGELNKIDERELLDPQAAKTVELRRYLSDSADKLTKGIEQSRVLRRTVGTTGFGIACISGALSATSDPRIAALVGGASFVAGGALGKVRSGRSGIASWRRIVPNIEFGDEVPAINRNGPPFDEAGMSAST